MMTKTYYGASTLTGGSMPASSRNRLSRRFSSDLWLILGLNDFSGYLAPSLLQAVGALGEL